MSQEEAQVHSDEEVLEVTRVDEVDVPPEIIARVRELHAQHLLEHHNHGENDAEGDENESGDSEDEGEDEDTSGRDTPSDLISPIPSSDEEEAPVPRRPAKAKAKSQREVFLWEKLLTVGVPTCPDHNPMRFDIGSEFFQTTKQHKYDPSVAKIIFETKKLAIPKTTGECIEFSFIKIDAEGCPKPDVKTLKADANFMRHHSETIAMFSKEADPEDPAPPKSKKQKVKQPTPSLFTDDPNKIHLRCPRRIFKLLLRILYNPGRHNKYVIELFRRDNLDELLSLASFLKIDAILMMINAAFASAYEVYSKVFTYYSKMVNSEHYRPRVRISDEEVESLSELLEDTPLGKFSIISRTQLIHVLDHHGLFDALTCVFKDMYALDSIAPCSDVLKAMKNSKHKGTWGHTAMSAMINVLYDNTVQAKKEADELKPYRPNRASHRE